VVHVAVAVGFLLVLAMLLVAAYVMRPRSLRFRLGVPRVFEVNLEIDNSDPPP
jgi:hypothetical protein